MQEEHQFEDKLEGRDVQPVDTLALDANADDNDAAGQEEGEDESGAQEETPMDVPFGWLGITMLLNILQYMVLLGLSLVVLILIRVFMPADMLP